MSVRIHERPLCPHCGEVITQLGVWTDEEKVTALFFCVLCGKTYGAQLLQPHEIVERDYDA